MNDIIVNAVFLKFVPNRIVVYYLIVDTNCLNINLHRYIVFTKIHL